jgi:HAD superfamily hydrolase (TIGR01490 family)
MTETNPSLKLALFDVAGTLTEGNTWSTLVDYPRIDRAKRRRLMQWAYPAWVASKLRLYSEVRFREGWIKGMARLLQGWPHEEVHELYTWIIRENTLNHLHQEVVARIQEHKAQGQMVVLVSNMFDEAVQMIAQHLGADAGLGTRLEFEQGICTGRIVGQSCAGEEKLRAVETWFATHYQQPVDLAREAVAYSDSWSDHFMLARVAQAVATYPDKRLRRYAETQGWQVILPPNSHQANRLDS